MNNFVGLGREYVESYFKKTGHGVFLRIRRTKTKVPKLNMLVVYCMLHCIVLIFYYILM